MKPSARDTPCDEDTSSSKRDFERSIYERTDMEDRQSATNDERDRFRKWAAEFNWNPTESMWAAWEARAALSIPSERGEPVAWMAASDNGNQSRATLMFKREDILEYHKESEIVPLYRAVPSATPCKRVPVELWDAILDFITDQVDVKDGAEGPRPNAAMDLCNRIAMEVE